MLSWRELFRILLVFFVSTHQQLLQSMSWHLCTPTSLKWNNWFVWYETWNSVIKAFRISNNVILFTHSNTMKVSAGWFVGQSIQFWIHPGVFPDLFIVRNDNAYFSDKICFTLILCNFWKTLLRIKIFGSSFFFRFWKLIEKVLPGFFFQLIYFALNTPSWTDRVFAVNFEIFRKLGKIMVANFILVFVDTSIYFIKIYRSLVFPRRDFSTKIVWVRFQW